MFRKLQMHCRLQRSACGGQRICQACCCFDTFLLILKKYTKKVANALQVAEKGMWRAKDLSGLLLL